MKSIRDKNHIFWKSCRAVIHLIETVLIGISSMIKFCIAVPFVLLIIVFINKVPAGALEAGFD